MNTEKNEEWFVGCVCVLERIFEGNIVHTFIMIMIYSLSVSPPAECLRVSNHFGCSSPSTQTPFYRNAINEN